MIFELKKTWHLLFCLVGGFIVISILAVLFIALMYRINDFWLFAWIIPSGAEVATPTNSAETIRNVALLFWIWLSLTGIVFGLLLSWSGRRIQQESKVRERLENLQERFEKASSMLSSELEATRIAACRSLMNLGKSDESMKSQCVRLLFAFINNPYLESEERSRYLKLKAYDRDKYLNKIFPRSQLLRPDIQQAIDSFSAIYEHYGMKGIDDEPVKLPPYFWKNEKKGRISLIKAKLDNTNLQNAYLEKSNLREVHLCHANLQGANLHGVNLMGADLLDASLRNANLQMAYLNGADFYFANLHGANLSGTTISNADMREVASVTKKQILLAQWGDADLEKFRGRPQLPEILVQDEDIKKWLEKATFDIMEIRKINKVRIFFRN